MMFLYNFSNLFLHIFSFSRKAAAHSTLPFTLKIYLNNKNQFILKNGRQLSVTYSVHLLTADI